MRHDYSLTDDELRRLKMYTVRYETLPLYEYRDKLSFFSNFQPYWFSNWYSPDLILLVNNLILRYRIEKVQIEFSQLLYLINHIPKEISSVFVSHDISSVSFIRRLSEQKRRIKDVLSLWRVLEIYIYERCYLPKYRVVVTVSERDAKSIQQIYACKNVYVCNNGIVDVHTIIKKSNKGIRLGYIGSFSHPPNRTSFEYFLKHIFPLLIRSKLTFTYSLAGNNSKHLVQNIIDSQSSLKDRKLIRNLGYISNLKEFYQDIDVLIAPLFAGSGTRIKILEALSYGTPVITTSIGAEGLEKLIDGKNLIIASKDEEYITSLQDISVKHRRTTISSKLKKYLWKSIFYDYANFLRSL